jgi:hypothetical protein
MRLRFRRRLRFTTPPEVIPLVVVGLVSLLVMQLVLTSVVLGWKFVRRLIVGWFRRQPPEPLGPIA